jgi:hypothetical protein
MKLDIRAAFGATDEPPEVPFLYPQARCRAVCLEIGRVDHDGLALGASGSQPFHHADEHAHLTHRFHRSYSVVQTIILRRMTPAQPVALHENNAAQHPPVIHAWLAVALGE